MLSNDEDHVHGAHAGAGDHDDGAGDASSCSWCN